MKILELFSGSGIMSETFKKCGWSVVTVDNKFNPLIKEDILKVNLNHYPSFDVIWASPPCTTFSVASIGTHWKGGKGAGGDGSNKESFTFTEKEERTCNNCKKKFTGWKFQNFCSSACSGVDNTPRTQKGKLPDKTLTMIPLRFALEMVNRGWILRNTIIWHKPNCMPSSVKDRFTVDFEYIFFFSKQKKYYFETQYEGFADNRKGFSGTKKESYEGRVHLRKDDGLMKATTNTGRNKRTVWRICPKPFSGAHFAVYPEELCETPIKAGCPIGGTVLDPFFGAGTTGLVALKQNKKFVGIELNPEYIKIAEKRLKPYLEQTNLNTLFQNKKNEANK